MKWMKALCATLAMLLVLGGCLASGEEELFSQGVDRPVEEMELDLGEDLAGEADAGTGVHAAEDAVPEEASGEALPQAGVEPTEAPQPTAAPEPQPEKIDVPEEITLGVGDTLQLDPVVEPADAVYEKLSYSSSKTKYAKVSADGLITAKKKGEAVVTVQAGSVTAQVAVHVKKAPKSVELKAERTNLSIGDTMKLTTTIPKGTVATWSYSVSPKGVVKVSKDGKVTAKKAGTATVTVTTHNKKKAKVKLTVMPDFEITFMNIGRNDGILIQCDGEFAFIDSGMHGQGVTAVKYMQGLGIDHLKYYIGTHAHRDHVGGAPAILAAIKTDTVIVSHSSTASKIKVFAENDAERKAVNSASYRTVKVDDTFKLGDAKFKVLGPTSIVNCDPGNVAENGNSLVLKLTYGKNTFLLTGDATGTEITAIERRSPGCMKAQVLKNPHHNGNLKYIVQLAKPEIVVFSTSSGSQPSASFLSFVRGEGAKYYITSGNRDGHVMMSSNGKKLKVKTQY